ncbi:hypothetical protein SOQ14_01825 [Erythrobacter sp. T5W1-R]|uniref:hypothetical protein n=1 Tax=Erythrobacter sp. T5W1-R TaxID=3101752 RepID=UPI002AFF486A|nr:hypothetical protein [Erythrobacter sp. T5W1-R]MEA1617646.1 hypothetical protein [Erythrobacter sp. T5W1-R]
MTGATRLIGVLGGTSWPSTMLAYRKLNEHAKLRLGEHHSARILLYSIDYHSIKSRYHHGWNDIPHLLECEVRKLLAWRPDYRSGCQAVVTACTELPLVIMQRAEGTAISSSVRPSALSPSALTSVSSLSSFALRVISAPTFPDG